MIIMGMLVKTPHPKKNTVIQCHKQAYNITIKLKAEVDFTVTELSAKHVVAWKCQVDDSSKGRYNIILWRDLLTELGLNL